jgi:hypothetical protein
MSAGRQSRFAAAAVLASALVPLALAQDLDPAKQREAQKALQAKLDTMARRAGSTIDAMIYQRLSASAEQQMLEEVAQSLRGLSQEQIKQVLTHLEAAIKAPDEATATNEQREAYQKHRQIISQLRGMVVKLDVVKNLDEAAARLDRAAEKQLALNAQSLDNVRSPIRNRARALSDDREEISGDQADLRAEAAAVFRQVKGMLPFLNPDQRERVKTADVEARGARLVSEMDRTVRTAQQGNFDDTAERQRRHAKELKDLAAALRTPPSGKLEALRQAREKVEKAIQGQQKVNDETARKPEDRPEPVRERPFRGGRDTSDPKQARGNELANEQAKVELDTRDARRATELASPEAAEKIRPAETNQWKAEDRLRSTDFEGATDPEEKALDALKAARDELDKQIAAAELAKKDPLAAVKNAAEEIEKLIRDQKDASAKTERAEENPRDLPEAKAAQKDVAKKTDEVRNTPLPPNAEVKDALKKAADAMRQANNKLDKQQPAEAKPNQKDALKALEDAKNALDRQAAAIEQRREDIAKLEDARQKLEELAKAEKGIADDALKAADAAKNNDPKNGGPKNPETGKLAEKQGDLQPPTKEVGMALKDIAPEAARKVDEAGTKQEGAKNDLARNQAKPGSEKADEAAQKLAEAARDVEKQLADRRGQEANEQAALQQNQDPNAAAQQLAKAIEQANRAAEKAKDASRQLDSQQQQPMNRQQRPNLAELQKQVADKAGEMRQPDAQKAASEAAKALQRGDLPDAIENQEKALDSLNRAARQPMQGEPMEGGNQPGELARTQQQLLDATRSLQQSRDANSSAQAALQQAQANTPMSVQPQLNQANDSLNQANGQLGRGQPSQAGQNQQNAANSLQQALDALNAAMAQGQQPGQGQPGQQPGQANGMEPGQGQPGQQPGQQPGRGQQAGNQPGQQPGQQPGPGLPMNEGISEGDRDGPEKLKHAASSGNGQAGDGGFIHLRKRERDKVQQAAEAQFPAEFRELIKQYNINIKNSKPIFNSPSPRP